VTLAHVIDVFIQCIFNALLPYEGSCTLCSEKSSHFSCVKISDKIANEMMILTA